MNAHNEALARDFLKMTDTVQAISHDPDTFSCLSNNGCVFI